LTSCFKGQHCSYTVFQPPEMLPAEIKQGYDVRSPYTTFYNVPNRLRDQHIRLDKKLTLTPPKKLIRLDLRSRTKNPTPTPPKNLWLLTTPTPPTWFVSLWKVWPYF